MQLLAITLFFFLPFEPLSKLSVEPMCEGEVIGRILVS